MSKIIFLQGLPGSGKSTWAKEYLKQHAEAIRVNKDDIREMLFGPDGWTKKRERLVIEIRNTIIFSGLDYGKTVIVDDTNLHPEHEKTIIDILSAWCEEYNLPIIDRFEVKFFDVPVEECIKRDSKREKPVGEKVIMEMYNKYLKPKVEYKGVNPKINNPKKPIAVICDLDGTLAHHNGRSPYDYDKISTDSLNQSVDHVVSRLAANGAKIIFLSGREEKSRDETVKWILNHSSVNNWDLHMRANKDFRKDAVIKEEIYRDKIAPNYNILAVFDDRNSCVDLWRSLDLPTFQVNYGDF